MKSRKIKALLLALILTASMPAIAQSQSPLSVSALIVTTPISGICGDDMSWTLDTKGTLTISGKGEMVNYSLSEYNTPWDKYAHLIKKIVVSDGVNTIGDYAFYEARSVTSIELPDSVTRLGKYAFKKCTSLEEIDLPKDIDEIGEGVFSGCRSLKSIQIPEMLMYIPQNAYSGCSSLKSVDIPENVAIIENYAFSDCSSMTEVTMSDSICQLGRGAFENCRSLEAIKLSDNIMTLEDSTFSNCDSLIDITLPRILKEIEDSAFSYCKNLETINIPEYVENISVNAFWYADSLTTINVDESNENYTSKYGVLYDKEMLSLIFYPAGKKAKSFTIPDGVENIMRIMNDDLETIVFPESLKTMDNQALYYCPSLTSLHITKDLNNISSLDNSNLKEITVDSSNRIYKSIDNVLFTKQTEELLLYPGLKEGESYAIPEDIRGVASRSFENTKYLKELKVHGNMSYFSIDALSSYSLPSSVTDIIFDGTEEEWNELLGDFKYGIDNVNMHFESDATSGDVLYNEERGLRGDINNDGTVSAIDLIHLCRYLLETEEKAEFSKYRFDVNADEVIDIADVIRLKLAFMDDVTLWDNTNIPVMDGSTSAIPLETGFKSKMLGISYSEASELVSHHKTHESFQLLLEGKNDLIFTVPISQEQRDMAMEAGKELTLTPVAKEGFVFIVNKDNPVDSLTQEQIRDIYSGKITNWSQVGGNDEEIIPYQRNKDSGSQNCMTDFMSGYDLMDAPKSYYLGSMSAIIDGVAFYDNSTRAIGYSVYSYAAKMYENMEDVKFIAVDGVKPSNETMANSTYPLLSNTFIAYTNEASAETIKFVQWAVSEEGQQCVLESGYVPLEDMKIPQHLRAYDKVGTGKEKPSDYKPSEKSSEFSRALSRNEKGSFEIDYLKNKDFQAVINKEINEAAEKYRNISVMVEAINGYMSVIIQDNSMDAYSPVSNILEVLNYNLIDNVKIENFSDLFYKDTEFVSMVNENISGNITMGYSRVNSGTAIPYETVMDFQCLIGNVDKFSLSEIIFDKNNRYFKNPTAIGFTSYYLKDYMVTEEYFDLNNVLDNKYIHDYESAEWHIINIEKDGMVTQQIGGSRFHTEEEVEELRKIYDIVYADAMERQKDNEYQRKVIISQHRILNALYVNYGKTDGIYERNLYDIKTGERICLSDIFGDDFKEYDDAFYGLMKIDTKNHLISIYVDNGEVQKYYDPDKVDNKFIKE